MATTSVAGINKQTNKQTTTEVAIYQQEKCSTSVFVLEPSHVHTSFDGKKNGARERTQKKHENKLHKTTLGKQHSSDKKGRTEKQQCVVLSEIPSKVSRTHMYTVHTAHITCTIFITQRYIIIHTHVLAQSRAVKYDTGLERVHF